MDKYDSYHSLHTMLALGNSIPPTFARAERKRRWPQGMIVTSTHCSTRSYSTLISLFASRHHR